jgi:signal transduction histidine kinase
MITIIVGFVATFIIVTLVIISLLFINNVKEQTLEHTKHWGQLIAKNVASPLSLEQVQNIDFQLSSLSSVPYLKHIHIYQVEPSTNKVSFFTSHKQNPKGTGILEKTDSITRLNQPIDNGNIIEYMAPINFNDNIIGYVYIQTSTEYIQSHINRIITVVVLITLLVLIITLLLSLGLEKFIVQPMRFISLQTQHIAQQKDFSIRFDAMPYKEIDIVTRNFNFLLSRAEKQIKTLDALNTQNLTHTSELEDKITKRTAALKDSNQELLSTLEKLHQFQGQLVESEKMASLGDMVAGVAHEVNTPIGLGVTASTLLSDRLLEIKKAFENKTLKSSHLKKFLNEGEENVGIIYRNLHRAANLISSFKKVAVDQSSEEERTFSVNAVLNEMLATLAPQIKHLPYKVTINCHDQLTIKSKPGPISQILINLILNSIIHGFEDKEQGNILISITAENDRLNVIYQDDGKGIDESMKTKLFEPFTTTKRGSGGSGLGLHLVYNLVTQALLGNIDFSSEKNQGVTFDITFPVVIKKHENNQEHIL